MITSIIYYGIVAVVALVVGGWVYNVYKSRFKG